MSLPVMATKLYIPRVRPNLVPRPRLTRSLDEGVWRKVTLVSAPAGFGKTTLVSEWIRGLAGSVAWLSLDENDNDLARFLSYLLAAMQQLDDEIGRTVQADLQSAQLANVEMLLTALVNELSAALFPPSTDYTHDHTSPPGKAERSGQRFVLVLDDYHTITALPIHDVLSFLVDNLPPQIHMVIISRSDPPLPLSRLRARGQLTELRDADLRFTHEEATAFLNEVMGLGLSAGDVAQLEDGTEGWIAGLQLAALSMQGREDTSSFLRAFTGTHRHILDYLTDEVFARQPEPVQTFLLQTAILDQLTGGLCDAITGREDGQATLERLERANLFVVPLDDARRWYRYHHLFADLLRYRLNQVLPDQLSELHRRACEWYARNGRVYEAMAHALAVRDFERAARLIKKNDLSVMLRGEVATLMGWLDMLPGDTVRSRPRLSISYAWAELLAANVDGLEQRLEHAIHALGMSERDVKAWPDGLSPEVIGLLGEITALSAQVAILRGDPRRAVMVSQQALERLPQSSALARVAVADALGDAQRGLGDVPAAIWAYEQALAASQAADSTLGTMVEVDNLAWSHVMSGQLYQAAETFRRVLGWGSGRQRPLLPVAKSNVGLGDVLREWNDLQSAEQHLLRGIAQCELGGYTLHLTTGYLALARVRQAQGEVEGMLELAHKALAVATGSGVMGIVARVEACRARLWLTPSVGDLAAAARWMQESGLSVDDAPYYGREFQHLTLVRVLLAESRVQPDEPLMRGACGLLARLLQDARAHKRAGSAIEILALQALVHQALGETAKAMVALEQALTRAEPEGFVRLFVGQGPPMAELLRQAAARGLAKGYVARLLQAWGKTLDPDLPVARVMVEPLTRRELEVLRLLAAGLSDREIAQELTIALSTAKSHAHKIYRKLDVDSRTQAVARARKWNLL